MAKPTGQSCPLCLRADEPESMVEIFIPHHLLESERYKLLCRQCAAMIAVAWRKLEDEEEVSIGRPDNRPIIGVRDSGGADAPAEADHSLVLEDRPGGGRPGVDSGEPGADAGGEGIPDKG